MVRRKCEIRIGTSGWHYNHWKERFYPEKLAKYKWLEYYAGSFDTVEINNTFYQLPKEANLKRWHKLAPADFIYSVKANRFITHIRKLKNAATELERFSERIAILKKKLGPVLYQLPPSLRKDLPLLRDFLEIVPKDELSVFEFRNETWFSQDCCELLDKFGKSFCIQDMTGAASPRITTGKLIYIRFHGHGSRYAGRYPKSVLADWANWIKAQIERVKGVYVYFNNDAEANAVINAKELKVCFAES